jgi:riboflavin synthase
VNEVTAETFAVLIIPHTLAVTTLGAAKPGTQVNIEIDLMARYAARLLETRENLS